ncbi:hypothetical protein POSPLADRAFT_1040102, partial [Postia placenta MAD-698-R-SB12]
ACIFLSLWACFYIPCTVLSAEAGRLNVFVRRRADNQNSQRAREGGSSMQEFLTIPADNAFVGVVT